MNWLLFGDILAAIAFLWTGIGIGYGLWTYIRKPWATVTIHGWAFIVLFMSIAYGIARFFS